MQFHAILSNPIHPEHGVASILFPLSREEYDHSIDILSALEIGNVVRQDCKIDEITDCYPVLKRLEGQTVNVDELDYLAKRLDSFTAGCEDEKFQAMAEKLDLTDIRDFINLTFCCEQATVITDFSNLEQIGRKHFINQNDRCVSMEELNNLDGEETARLLINSGSGFVTPYGVVYDNGMELEQLYTGGAFPAYLHETSPIAVIASPLSEPEGTDKVTFFGLPMTEKQIQRTLTRGGIKSAEQMRFKLELIFPQGLSFLPDLEQDSLDDLNEMCAAIAPLTQNDLNKLSVAIILARPQNASHLKHLAENLDLFDFIPEVKTPEEYGRYMIEQSGHFEYDPNLEGFYDFEGYARQRMRQEMGQFIESGYVSYHGTMSSDELMADSQEQDFQMGGMR